MKTLFTFVLVASTMLSVSACRVEKNNVEAAKKSYDINVEAFHRITTAGAFDVHFVQGNSYKVTLKASPETRERVNIYTKDGNLVAEWRKNKRKNLTEVHFGADNDDVDIWVTAPSIDYVAMAGSADFTAENNLRLNNLTIAVSGSADVSLKEVVCANNFIFNVSGSGDFEAKKVQAQKVDLAIAGSGDVQTALYRVDHSTLKIFGSGDAELNFLDCNEASATISGSGSLEVKGTLRQFHRQIGGSGSIDDSELTIKRN